LTEPPEARLAREVTRTLQAFAGEFPDEVVERVVLVSRFAVDRAGLERAVGLPVEVPTVLSAASLGVDTGPVGELSVTFAPAVGVAWPEVAWRSGVPMHLERVNLLTQRQARWEREGRYRRARVAVLAVALAVVGMLLPVSLAAVRLVNLVVLGRKLEALAPQVKELEAIEQRLALLRPWTGEKALPLDILAELTRVATPEVYVKSVSVNDGGRLALEGLATGYEGAYALVRALAGSNKLVSDVSLVGGHRGSSTEAGGDPRFSYEFTVTAQVLGWAAQGPPRPSSTAGQKQEVSATEESR
jgi:Tfp pilus assembly protein PilN